MAKGDSVLETLANSDSFVFVLFEGKRISGCYEIVYHNDVARDIIQSLARDSLKSTPTLIECADLCFWKVLQASSFPAIYNRKDKLVKDWANTYFNKLQSAEEYYYKDARKLISSDLSSILCKWFFNFSS